jgi:hypothetical protein
MIAPSYSETLTEAQSKARIRQLGARHVRSKSKPGRQVYWIPSKQTWILASPRGGYVKLGYYQMERCPCEDD